MRMCNFWGALPPETRLWLRVWKAADCWIWRGGLTGKGYGPFTIGWHKTYVHRLVYVWAKGPIPSGMEIDHRCRQPACVRPSHLVAVRHRDNLLSGRGWAAQYARATHCIAGHAWDEANTHIQKNGTRYCRACARRRQRERKARLRAQH